jgi:hypothetical protein
MSDPFTIRIFVPDGEPDGVRIIDRMNWTGVGVVFPREKWSAVRKRQEMSRTGVYILIGYANPEDELPTLYIGQGDEVRTRIESHNLQKEFWTWGITFSANGDGLNRAHVTWLEHALVRAAKDASRCHLVNGNSPHEPSMSEADKADTRAFLKEILQVLPLVGLHAFERPRAIVEQSSNQLLKDKAPSKLKAKDDLDTIIVPAKKDGFEEVFLGQNAWWAIRIGGGMLPKIKYIAAYQSQPVSAITHVAEVARIEPYGEDGKYRLVFTGPAQKIPDIPFGAAISGAMQGPRYTYYTKLMSAKSVAELVT